eukprot:c6118_g1_i2 orf=192-554(+)
MFAPSLITVARTLHAGRDCFRSVAANQHGTGFSQSKMTRTGPGKGRPKTAVQAESNLKMCLCSPTTHAGSFKCRLHRGLHWGSLHIASSSTSTRAAAAHPPPPLPPKPVSLKESRIRKPK